MASEKQDLSGDSAEVAMNGSQSVRPTPGGQVNANQSRSVDRFGFKDLITLIRLGCLAGIQGCPVSFVFRDFTSTVVSEILALVAAWFAAEEIAEVSTQTELRRIKARLNSVRVVLIYGFWRSANLANTLSWFIERRRNTGEPLPVMMSLYHPDLEDTPTTMVIIRGGGEVNSAAGQWLFHNKTATSPVFLPSSKIGGIPKWSPLLAALHAAASQSESLSLTDNRLLEALLTAYWIELSVDRRKHVAESPQGLVSAYEEIRRLLQHPMLRKVGEPVDDLTYLMVDRANTYLRARSGQLPSVCANVGARTGARSTIEKTNEIKTEGNPNSITFLELVNLGNPRSPEFQAILGFCRSDPILLKKNGIRIEPLSPHARSPPQDRKSAGGASDSVTWSYKQARTRFERLRKSKLIEARRSVANGPYEYVLPEELRTDQSQFSHLPTVEAVQKHLVCR